MAGHNLWRDIRRPRKGFKKAWYGLKRLVWGGYHSGGLCGFYHWLRCHTWNRYHVIDVSGQDGYTWGYQEPDYLMLLACFKLLVGFVEEQDPTVGLRTIKDYDSQGEWNAEETARFEAGQLADEREVRALYDWWVKGRHDKAAELEAFSNGLPRHDPRWNSWYERKTALDAEDQEMLLRLVSVRSRLWS